jgi:hypothetical protein
MAFHEGEAGARSVAPHRLDHQAPEWNIASDTGSALSLDELSYRDGVTPGPTAMKEGLCAMSQEREGPVRRTVARVQLYADN